MPSIKYSLEGIEIKMKSIFARHDGLFITIEGIASLIGDIAIKPSGGTNSVNLLANHKTIELQETIRDY